MNVGYVKCTWKNGSASPEGNRAVYVSRVFGGRADFIGEDDQGREIIGIMVPAELTSPSAVMAALNGKIPERNRQGEVLRQRILDGLTILSVTN